MLGNSPNINRDIFFCTHDLPFIFAAEILRTIKPNTMKNPKNIMLIVLAAFMIMPIPQMAEAQENIPEVKIEKREIKPKRRAERARAMRDKDFSMMYKIVKDISFDKNKIDMIRVACIGSSFNSNQCARLLSLFSFDDNKIEVLKVIKPRLVDVDNYKKIFDQFSFSSNKEKAAEILLKR